MLLFVICSFAAVINRNNGPVIQAFLTYDLVETISNATTNTAVIYLDRDIMKL
ncbi:hypothetical protein D3C73_1339080 [compost metagenome]